MRRISVLITIGLFLTFKLEAKKIEGKIFFEKDTIDVTFIIPIKLSTQEPNYEKLQYKVKYFDQAGNKVTLQPDNAKEIQFTYEYVKVRMLSRFNSLGIGKIYSDNRNIFIRLEIDGKLKLFDYYETPKSYYAMNGMSTGFSFSMPTGSSYAEEKYAFQKGDGEVKRLDGLTFKEDMAIYFSDCPAIVEKIENDEGSHMDLEPIVRFYNSNCR